MDLCKEVLQVTKARVFRKDAVKLCEVIHLFIYQIIFTNILPFSNALSFMAVKPGIDRVSF